MPATDLPHSKLDLSGAGVRHARALPVGEPAAGAAPAPAHADVGRMAPWIQLLAALGLDPHALWPATVSLDFEGDQCTAIEPSRDELRALYGIDVQELDVWRPLAEHAIEHLAAGRALVVEADAFWLPVDAEHRRSHAKRTIVLNEVDLDARRIGYFHGAGHAEAHGDDVTHLLGLEDDTSDLEAIADWRGARVAQVGATVAALDEGRLPPRAQFVRADRRVARSTAELRMLALHHLGNHLAFRPATNPLRRFAARIADDLPLLREYGTAYHEDWASCTVRRFAGAFDLAARGLAWQDESGDSRLREAAHAFEQLARDAATLDQRLGRAAASAKNADTKKLLETMALAWDGAMAALDAAWRSEEG
ncbi:DUF1839 family protein [Scleromatobacter humisilvae]|uniref:DUF1839 family protein n=1 Tax=Scleromatobacter humisilvae TaxID=2897159 RepID=A0A9X2C4E0_9BURK|nr:DUF1839 family protein [Scleromatobacter humisilvae]MCK9689300.1 DUF1839 family protein [Scleromatobacter humisilvae]